MNPPFNNAAEKPIIHRCLLKLYVSNDTLEDFFQSPQFINWLYLPVTFSIGNLDNQRHEVAYPDIYFEEL